MSDLEEALKKFNENEKLADTVMENVEPKFRGGRESLKRDAEAARGQVRRAYAQLLHKAAFGVVISGPGTEKFIALAEEEVIGLLSIDGGEMFNKIADAIEPTLGVGREFGVGQFGRLIQEVATIAKELGIYSMASPKWTEAASTPDRKGLVNHIKAMVNSSIGTELLALYVQRQLTDAGLKSESTKANVPVLIHGIESERAQELGNAVFSLGRGTAVEVQEGVTREFVVETFGRVKKQFKKQQNQAQ